MCPACLTTAALIAAGTTSVGGLGVLFMKILRPSASAPSAPAVPQPQGESHDTSNCLAS